MADISHESKIEVGESSFSFETGDTAAWHLDLAYHYIVLEGRTLTERDVYELFEKIEFALRSIFSRFKISELFSAEEAMKVDLADLDPVDAGKEALNRLLESGICTHLD